MTIIRYTADLIFQRSFEKHLILLVALAVYLTCAILMLKYINE